MQSAKSIATKQEGLTRLRALYRKFICAFIHTKFSYGNVNTYEFDGSPKILPYERRFANCQAISFCSWTRDNNYCRNYLAKKDWHLVEPEYSNYKMQAAHLWSHYVPPQEKDQ